LPLAHSYVKLAVFVDVSGVDCRMLEQMKIEDEKHPWGEKEALNY